MKSIDELIKIADLAKLSLDGEDLDALFADMTRYMTLADAVKTADTGALDSIRERELAPLREDVMIPSYPVEELLRNAVDSQDGHYVADTGGRRAR